MPNIMPCPQCGVRLRVPDDAVGRQGKCPECQTRFRFEVRSDQQTVVPPPKLPDPAPDIASGANRASSERGWLEAPGRLHVVARSLIFALRGLLALLGFKSLITATPSAELSPQQRQAAEERAHRWTGQQLRAEDRKTESENNVLQLQFDLNRFITARNDLAQKYEVRE